MSESRSSNEGRKLALTSRIVAAYLSRNAVHAGDLPDLIQQTFSSLSGTFPRHQAEPAVEEQRPAVPIKKSVTVDFIICLEDGEKIQIPEAPPDGKVRPHSGAIPGDVGPPS